MNDLKVQRTYVDISGRILILLVLIFMQRTVNNAVHLSTALPAFVEFVTSLVLVKQQKLNPELIKNLGYEKPG